MIKDTSLQDEVLVTKKNNTSWVKRGGGIFVAAVILYGLNSVLSPLLSGDKSVSIKQMRFATVTRGDFYRDVTVQGRLVAANSPTLFASMSGIVNYFVKSGDKVKKGQMLARIKSPELTNLLEQEHSRFIELELAVESQKIEFKSAIKDAQQAIDIGKVNLNSATLALTRANIGIEKKLISQVDFEIYQAAEQTAKVNFEHSKQNITFIREKQEFELKTRKIQFERQKLVYNNFKRRVDEMVVKSPITGLIGNINFRDYDQVDNNQALITVIKLDDYEVEVNIPEIYADELLPPLKAEIKVNGKVINGILTAISPEVEDGQVVGRLRFDTDIPDGLRQNQRVSAKVLIESKENVLKIKRGSFLDSSGGRFAYVVNGDYALKKNVIFGLRSVTEVEVVSGLKEGDKLVISNVESFANFNKIYLLQ